MICESRYHVTLVFVQAMSFYFSKKPKQKLSSIIRPTRPVKVSCRSHAISLCDVMKCK